MFCALCSFDVMLLTSRSKFADMTQMCLPFYEKMNWACDPVNVGFKSLRILFVGILFLVHLIILDWNFRVLMMVSKLNCIYLATNTSLVLCFTLFLSWTEICLYPIPYCRSLAGISNSLSCSIDTYIMCLYLGLFLRLVFFFCNDLLGNPRGVKASVGWLDQYDNV